ncbi:MAG: hypothetical protein ACOCVA_08270, partial [Prolixibacteraceae bacterium]
MKANFRMLFILTAAGMLLLFSPVLNAQQRIGTGAESPAGAEMLFDGSHEMLHEKWTYWKGPRFSAEMPVKWEITDDPVDDGTVVSADDP